MNKQPIKVALVVGARPNFIKAAPLVQAMVDSRFKTRLVHTGQHSDFEMSDVFFEQLRLPKPDIHLNVMGRSPSRQIAEIILALEEELLRNRPQLVIVFGDVNSTLAAAVTANKLSIPLAHVEAGLRSFDRRMPEEHNRLVTDALADLLFTPSPDADKNLRNEGVPRSRIYRVGNIMIDSLLRWQTRAKKMQSWKRHHLKKGGYVLVTLHRPSNVDSPEMLESLLIAMEKIAEELPVVFPIHPRTKSAIEQLASVEALSTVRLLPPLSYLEFLSLMISARVVLTDSGGIQEETTALGVPCLTVRENTERPITITQGTNRLVGTSTSGILRGFRKVLKEKGTPVKGPQLWDGKTAKRIVQILDKHWS
jgi:UDP-N-acetylglucosamine 2-epimerase (non-hydrolysing)